MTSPVSPLHLAVLPAPVSPQSPAVASPSVVPPSAVPVPPTRPWSELVSCKRLYVQTLGESELSLHAHPPNSPRSDCMNCVLPFSMNQMFDHQGLLAKRREQERAEEASTSSIITVSAADLRLLNPINISSDSESSVSSPVSPVIDAVQVSPKRRTETQAGTSSSRIQPTTRKHTGVTCQECGKYLYSKQTLSEHMRMHTGEKPFKCGPCDKEFTRKRDLTKHQKTKAHMRNQAIPSGSSQT